MNIFFNQIGTTQKGGHRSKQEACRRQFSSTRIPLEVLNEIVNLSALQDAQDVAQAERSRMPSLRTPQLHLTCKHFHRRLQDFIENDEGASSLKKEIIKKRKAEFQDEISRWHQTDRQMSSGWFFLRDFSGPATVRMQKTLFSLRRESLSIPVFDLMPAHPGKFHTRQVLFFWGKRHYDFAQQKFLSAGPSLEDSTRKRFLQVAPSWEELQNILDLDPFPRATKSTRLYRERQLRKNGYFFPSEGKAAIFLNILAYYLAVSDKDIATALSEMLSPYQSIETQFTSPRGDCAFDRNYESECGELQVRHYCGVDKKEPWFFLQMTSAEWNIHDRYNAAAFALRGARLMLEHFSFPRR